MQLVCWGVVSIPTSLAVPGVCFLAYGHYRSLYVGPEKLGDIRRKGLGFLSGESQLG